MVNVLESENYVPILIRMKIVKKPLQINKKGYPNYFVLKSFLLCFYVLYSKTEPIIINWSFFHLRPIIIV